MVTDLTVLSSSTTSHLPTPERLVLNWSDINHAVNRLVARHRPHLPAYDGVYGIPRGGVAPALLVSARTSLPMLSQPTLNTLVVDDLVDSGSTLEGYRNAGHTVDALYRKPWSPATHAPNATEVDSWLVFPWEELELPAEDNVRRLLEAIGEDPTRDGLLDTPRRVVKAWTEMTAGMHMDPADVLATTFDVPYDELVAVTGIPFVSLCEHHVLPFVGTVSVGYLPGTRVVGLSKLARVVDIYAKRLQVQERMTQQIAEAIQTHLKPQGVGVIVRGTHSCMSARGIQKEAEMRTSAMLGKFRDNPALRAEFLALDEGGK